MREPRCFASTYGSCFVLGLSIGHERWLTRLVVDLLMALEASTPAAPRLRRPAVNLVTDGSPLRAYDNTGKSVREAVGGNNQLDAKRVDTALQAAQ